MADSFINRHLKGEGGISQVMIIAFPMIISQGAETIMLFVDRLFLAKLGPEYVAAALSGGLSMFMMMTFFMGIIGYINALVAQYYGARKPELCGLVTAQGLILALVSYPIILAAIPLGLALMRIADHDAVQQVQEAIYFKILAFGTVFGLLRVGLGSFFAGIGKTRIVMFANLTAMVVNIIANYILIFGRFGCPELRMAGAAYGTIIGSLVGLLILAVAYFSETYRKTYGIVSGLRFDREMFSRLFRFGFPAGSEFFLNLAAFNVFIQAFQSYGKDAATAMSITFSWDLMAFLPMTGISIAVTSLVGRYMGCNQPELAKRSTYSALKVAWAFSTFMTCLFLFCPGFLVSWFSSKSQAADYQNVLPLATTMLRIAAIYVTSDATFLVFSGALRGAGDTKWAMRVSVLLHWLMTGVCLTLIRFNVRPVLVWVVFALLIGTLALSFFLRFRSNRWQGIKVI